METDNGLRPCLVGTVQLPGSVADSPAVGTRFFRSLLVRLVVITAGPLVVGWWLGGPIVGAGAATILGALELWRIDRTVRTGVSDRVAFRSTPPGDLTWLDETAIRAALRDLRMLGFMPIADCSYSVPVSPPGFTRVLVHRAHHIYACVAQGRRGMHVPEAVAVTLFSALTDGRSLTTTTSQPDPTMVFGLQSNDSWQVRPDGAVHELIVEHLATRREMAAVGGAKIWGDGSLDDFVSAQQAVFHRQAQHCRMNGALGAIRRGLRWERHLRKSWVAGVFSKETPLIAPPIRTSGPTPAGAAPPRRAAKKAPPTTAGAPTSRAVRDDSVAAPAGTTGRPRVARPSAKATQSPARRRAATESTQPRGQARQRAVVGPAGRVPATAGRPSGQPNPQPQAKAPGGPTRPSGQAERPGREPDDGVFVPNAACDWPTGASIAAGDGSPEERSRRRVIRRTSETQPAQPAAR